MAGMGSISWQEASSSALAEWNQALAWDGEIEAWHKAHPRESFPEPWQYGQAERDFLKANGIPNILDAGRITYVGATYSGAWSGSWPVLKLRKRSEWGRYAITCGLCNCLALVHHVQEGAGHCHTCREKVLAERAKVKAARRIESRKARSLELANRRGLCLVCHSEMTVARGSRRTCSDRCRKQLLRHPDRYQLPTTPEQVKIGEQSMPLAEAKNRLDSAHGNRVYALVMSGQGEQLNSDPSLQSLKKAQEQVARMIQLQKLREEAPAVFLAEISTEKTGTMAPESA